MSDSERRPESGRQAFILVGLEFAVFAGVYFADWTHHIYISKIPYLFALAWLSLRLRGLLARCWSCLVSELAHDASAWHPGWPWHRSAGATLHPAPARGHFS